MNKKVITSLFSCVTLIAVENSDELSSRKIPITKDTLITYRNDIDSFIDTKRSERDQLLRLPDGNSFFGKATNFVIEFIAPLFTRYGSVNIEEAKIFLSRSFEHEELLKKAIDSLQENDDIIAYLDTIFSQAEGEILNKRDSIRFLEIVKKTKYKKVPNPKRMGEKNHHGEYIIGDADFYAFSAATLMAFHIFENHIPEPPVLKRPRRANIHAKYREEFA